MEVSTIEHSIARKLLYVLVVMFLFFAAIMIHTVLRLKHVGDEIQVIQKKDLPILHKWSDLNQVEFKRHLLLQELHYEASKGQLTEEVFQEAKDAFDSYTLRINTEMIRGVLSATDKGDSLLLYELLELKHGREGVNVVERFATLQGEVKKHADPFFLGSHTAEELDSHWEMLEESQKGLEKLIEDEIYLILKESESEADQLAANEKQLIQTVIFASIALVILSSLLIRNFLKQITVPLAAVTEQSTRIAKGDLTSEPVEVTTRDEIAVLAAAFQTTQDRLRNQIGDMQQSTGLLASSIQQTSASIEEQASSTKEEAATIQEITATMQEIQQSGTEIAQRATQLQQSSQQNLKESEEGLAAVEATSGSMERIREQIEEVAEKIVNLSEKTRQSAILSPR